MPPPDNSSPRQRQAFALVLKIIYVALFGSVGLYWAVLEMMAPERELPPEFGPVKLALYVFAGGAAAGVLYLRFSRIGPLLLAPAVDATQQLTQLRVFYIICFVLSESVGLFGFVLRILGAERTDVIPFFLGSFILFVLCYPRAPRSATGPLG